LIFKKFFTFRLGFKVLLARLEDLHGLSKGLVGDSGFLKEISTSLKITDGMSLDKELVRSFIFRAVFVSFGFFTLSLEDFGRKFTDGKISAFFSKTVPGMTTKCDLTHGNSVGLGGL
jgi:hypothetical protein